MAIDAVCWLIFATAIGLITLGCIYTRAETKPSGDMSEDALDTEDALDRAA